MVRRAAYAAFFAFAASLWCIPASAQVAPDIATSSILAQAKPIGRVEAPIHEPSLPQGLSYTWDVWSSYSLGHTGAPNASLPGGMDGVLGYGFNRHIRAQIGYYQLSEYPIGFSTGTVPLYLQGYSAAIGSAPLSTNDATIKNQIVVANLQTLWTIGRKLAIVITPTYVARWGSVGGHSDTATIENNGFPLDVHLRTFQYQGIAVTVPFISSPRVFATYTIMPQWLVRLNGANTLNHAQLFQLLYAEYRPSRTSTIFFQPSLLNNYTPVDQYPQHIPTIIIGGTQRIPNTVKSPFYLQFQLTNGTPTNPPNNTIGISQLTCQRLPCGSSQVAPTINGLKASQMQLMLGFGQPSVVPL